MDDDGPVRTLDNKAFHHLLSNLQDGVVARRQLVELGAKDHEIARMVRRRELVTVHRGVFVNHTGPLTYEQRAYAAVLVHWPAALTRESALPKPSKKGPIHVAIDLRRTVTPVPGVQAHCTPDFQDRVAWNKTPPRVSVEHAVIDVTASHHDDPLAMFRVLADACQARQTRADRIAKTLRQRNRVPGKALMLAMLEDLATGACSVLERGYLHRVERAHGPPKQTARSTSSPTADRHTATPTTRSTGSWSSWTGGRSTTPPPPATLTPIATSKPASRRRLAHDFHAPGERISRPGRQRWAG